LALSDPASGAAGAEIKTDDTLVDVSVLTPADAGSIPAASIRAIKSLLYRRDFLDSSKD